MDCSQWTAFAKYPQLMKMDPNQTDEYMIKLQSLLIEISPMPLPQQASRLHDFFMANAAMICMQRADESHLDWWEAKRRFNLASSLGNVAEAKKWTLVMKFCELERDEAMRCKESIRAHLHAGGAA
jgi:hypothetical protein